MGIIISFHWSCGVECRELCSLVPQEDVLLSSFTVRETLMFSAHLRLPPTKTTAQKAAIVQEVRHLLIR